ncbi:hypothetical protein G9A89_001505 [Geosiphon pyriformis]|nr:hypothetical protein G9A89_001505 [Geosiphon pyriformis]
MPIQEHGDLINYTLERGVNKYDVEIKEFKTQELKYRKTRHQTVTNPYAITLYDPISDAALAEVQGQKSNAKTKSIMLYQPDDVIEFRETGKINFEYRFQWENEDYVWRKRGSLFSKELECKMVHDPDPGIGISLYQPKNNTLGIVTLMYWNMDRIPVKDKRGLEYCLVVTLLAFLDEWDDKLLKKSVSLVKGSDKVNESPSTPPRPTGTPPHNSSQPNSHPKKKKEKTETQDEDLAMKWSEHEAYQQTMASAELVAKAKEQQRMDKKLAQQLIADEQIQQQILAQKQQQEKADEEFARRLMEEEKEEALKAIKNEKPTSINSATHSLSPPVYPQRPSSLVKSSSTYSISSTNSTSSYPQSSPAPSLPVNSYPTVPQPPPHQQHYNPQPSPPQYYYPPVGNPAVPYNAQISITMPMPMPLPNPIPVSGGYNESQYPVYPPGIYNLYDPNQQQQQQQEQQQQQQQQPPQLPHRPNSNYQPYQGW